MTDTIITNAVLSIVLVYYKSKIAKLTKETQ